MKDTDREIMLRHIKRLQERNSLLAEVIADERKLRKAAWETYYNRIHNHFLYIMDMVIKSERVMTSFNKQTNKTFINNGSS